MTARLAARRVRGGRHDHRAPQPGNPRPRIGRLPEARALVNRMGFPNAGAGGGGRVGPRSGRGRGRREHRQVEAVAALEAAEDYGARGRLAPTRIPGAQRELAEHARAAGLQAAERLDALVARARGARARRRAPCRCWSRSRRTWRTREIDAVADLAARRGLDGLIATNTTIARPGGRSSRRRGRAGGCPGAPLQARSLEVLRRLRSRVGDELVLVSVGGVESAEDALERLRGRRDARAGLHRVRLRRAAVAAAGERRARAAASSGGGSSSRRVAVVASSSAAMP